MAIRRIGQIFVDLGFITDDQLDALLEEQSQHPGQLLGKVAEAQNRINEEQLAQALAEQFGMQVIHLADTVIPPTVLNLVTEAMAQMYRIVPIAFKDNTLTIAAHGLGGTVGALLTGVFAQKALNGVADGLLFGNPGQLGIQAIAVGAAIVYSGGMSFVLLKLIGMVMPLRADASEENEGLDVAQHGEEAYVHGGDMVGARH